MVQDRDRQQKRTSIPRPSYVVNQPASQPPNDASQNCNYHFDFIAATYGCKDRFQAGGHPAITRLGLVYGLSPSDSIASQTIDIYTRKCFS